jgi:hypothetical protein
MRLHTRLTINQLYDALLAAQDAGHVTKDVDFKPSPEMHGSRTHNRAFDVQLGTYSKDSLPAGTKDQHGKNMKVRRYRNAGDSGATSGWHEPSVWAATWHEWGWFMLEVFKLDPEARFGSAKDWHYAGLDDFHRKTEGAFREPTLGNLTRNAAGKIVDTRE